MCAGLNSFGILACPARSLPLALCFSLFVTMVKITEVINKRGLNFRNQRKVMMYRAQKPPLAFSKIAELVRNMQKKPSTEDVCRRVYDRFNVKNGFVKYNYGNCGRTPWKITKEVAAFIVRQLKKDRRKTVCTSTTLQAALFKDMGVKVGTSAIRKCLRKAGYWWLPRAQKRKYSKEVMKTRRAFVRPFAARSQKVIHDRITFAMDGVVLTTPPTDPVERANYCFHGVTHMYRKKTEAASPDLAGEDPYAQQVPLARAVPLWGAISARGFSEVCFHKTKKLDTQEWIGYLKGGALTKAVQKLKPSRGRCPWTLLCDGESFLRAKDAKKIYKTKNIQLLQIPAKSPDLNPIESFWGWLRQQLRLRDLQDLRAGRPALGKTAYKIRVKNLLRSKKAQEVAKNKFKNFKAVCKEVLKKKGAASRT